MCDFQDPGCRVGRRAVSLLLIMLLPVTGWSQDLVRTAPPSFEYEQCALAVQIAFDDAASACFQGRDASVEAVLGQCLQKARRAYEAGLRTCPLDTGKAERS